MIELRRPAAAVYLAQGEGPLRPPTGSFINIYFPRFSKRGPVTSETESGSAKCKWSQFRFRAVGTVAPGFDDLQEVFHRRILTSVVYRYETCAVEMSCFR